jgi:type III protein arginine methyltransferase
VSRRPRKAPPSPERLEVLLAYHQTMLADQTRNRAFARALRARVRPGATVMDLGSGSGIWAVYAARLGAKRVVAVEKQPLLVPVIERFARDNGVADRVVVANRESRQLDLPRSFDVIVSETVGIEAFDEDIVAVLADARRRFLKRGGFLVPEGLALAARPAHLPDPLGVRPPLLRDGGFRALVVHAPSAMPPDRFLPLSRAATLLRVDLRTALPPVATTGLRASYRMADATRVDCFGIWAEIALAPRVHLATRDASSWGLTYFPVEPFPKGPCRLDFELSLGERRAWRATWTGASGRREERAYSPLFAFGAVGGRRLAR